MGLNPAWRKALVHIVFGSIWPEGASLDVINEVREKNKNGEAAFRKLTPDGGAYFNEVSVDCLARRNETDATRLVLIRHLQVKSIRSMNSSGRTTTNCERSRGFTTPSISSWCQAEWGLTSGMQSSAAVSNHALPGHTPS